MGIFLVIILILQMVFSFFAAFGKDHQWTVDFNNYYTNWAVQSRDITACEGLDNIPVMGLKIDTVYYRSAGTCYAEYFKVNPPTLAGCMKLEEAGNYYRSDCIGKITSDADLFSQGASICDSIHNNELCINKAAVYFHDVGICKK